MASSSRTTIADLFLVHKWRSKVTHHRGVPPRRSSPPGAGVQSRWSLPGAKTFSTPDEITDRLKETLQIYESISPGLPQSVHSHPKPVSSASIVLSRSNKSPVRSVPMALTKYSLVATGGRCSSRAWHSSAARIQALSFSICLTLLICFIVSSTRGGATGTTELFSGKCSHAANITSVMQALLALLAIGVSVCSDFFIRLVSSPTVGDLREAHSQGRSLDIGVHSLRNVFHISCWRTFGWSMLILLAIPIQIFSHSIAFMSFSTSGYSRMLVSEAFTAGQPFAYPGVALLKTTLEKSVRSQFNEILPNFESASREWSRLEMRDCRRIYSQDLEGLQSHRNLLVVIKTALDSDEKGWNATQVWNATSFPPYENDSELVNSLLSFATYCEVDRVGYSNNGGYTQCYFSREANADYSLESWGKGAVRDDTSSPENIAHMNEMFWIQRVKYCFSEPYSTPCKVYVSNFFLLVTMLCIFFGCACSTIITWSCWHEETCQSLGDVLQTFLKDGETFFQMKGALAPDCASEGTSPPSNRSTLVTNWKKARPQWGQSISRRTWLWTYVPMGILLLDAAANLGYFGKQVSQVPNPPFASREF